MEHDVPPLLVIADLPPGFRLADLTIAENHRDLVQVNEAKYQDLDFLELITDGMAFTLRHINADETHQNLMIDALKKVFCDPAEKSVSCIGISPGSAIKDGKHIAVVNRAFLRLATLVGQSVEATHMAWLPAEQIVGIDYFSESVSEYLGGGPDPGACTNWHRGNRIWHV